MSKNSFMVFEIKTDFTKNKKTFLKSTTIETFSKQIFQKLKNEAFNKTKFPSVVKSMRFLTDFLQYFAILKKNNLTSHVFLIKIHYYLIKKNINIVENIFLDKSNLKSLNFLIKGLITRKGIIYAYQNIFYPFVKV
jgi:hypothetical protein